MIRSLFLLSSSLFILNNAFALTAEDILVSYKTEASTSADFKEFSIERGAAFFKTPAEDGDLTCVSCHTANPAAFGKHHDTGKEILPLAPSSNPDRFTEMEKVEKWFKRNCNDVHERPCTVQEKGDVLVYLMSVKDEVAATKFKSIKKVRVPASKKIK